MVAVVAVIAHPPISSCITPHYLRPSCLPLVMPHYSILLPWCQLHTIALPSHVCWALDRTSLSKPSALGVICYLLFQALSELQKPFIARSASAVNADTL